MFSHFCLSIMALITVSGFPSSGKSTRSSQLKAFLDAKLADPDYNGPALTVQIISDDSLNIDRAVYNDSRSEKPARGAIFTAMQREMSPNKILIIDSLNYIKGFRYQMYCAAREAKVRVATLYVVAPPDTCREWNTSRQDGKSYQSETFDNLIQRYEEPSSMVRWDSPLFTVLWEDESVPGEAIWEAITKGNIKPPNSGTLHVAKAPSDALHILEQTTTSMVSSVLAEASNAGGSGGLVTISPSQGIKARVTLPARNVTLSELQRLKRQFVTVHKKAITLGSTERDEHLN
ncbi:hypothetical protein CC1G_11553 [Coprinopsis cinerea okayama7|uniref:Chromatin associated protein KTI12 n=1 Tax=Coprinopsis cinerea (strain Okayama-7 / 130 / ATCC MYA-4618 / FGSC 9003) TaxID=240176 RepID=A8N6T9_COPC7|nr:hypothetical protein CC1G_11553 [Coprinopsis cinerea okayama7\|eukprot:XP_001830545.2 hypothetical protein CC1G_11553 [Coprinopsis cinerea okayama7\